MNLRKKEAVMGILFVLPFMTGFLLFYMIPFVISIRYSFTSGIGGSEFVGFQNYIEVCCSHAFRMAAANTFRFIGVGIPLIMGISLGLSLLIFQSAKNMRLFRSIFLSASRSTKNAKQGLKNIRRHIRMWSLTWRRILPLSVRHV